MFSQYQSAQFADQRRKKERSLSQQIADAKSPTLSRLEQVAAALEELSQQYTPGKEKKDSAPPTSATQTRLEPVSAVLEKKTSRPNTLGEEKKDSAPPTSATSHKASTPPKQRWTLCCCCGVSKNQELSKELLDPVTHSPTQPFKL